MKHIFKNLIPYWKSILLIVLLLVVQAYCDLSLPQYTSDIIDTGIQNNGAEHIVPEKITAKDIFDAAKEGDAFALRMVEQLGRTLGMACARIATVVDPEAFVFGGGVSKAGRMLTDVIEKYYDQYAFKTGAKFLLAELGNDAGIYGSVKLILDAHAAGHL